jgi:hypothetical protein
VQKTRNNKFYIYYPALDECDDLNIYDITEEHIAKIDYLSFTNLLKQYNNFPVNQYPDELLSEVKFNQAQILSYQIGSDNSIMLQRTYLLNLVDKYKRHISLTEIYTIFDENPSMTLTTIIESQPKILKHVGKLKAWDWVDIDFKLNFELFNKKTVTIINRVSDWEKEWRETANVLLFFLRTNEILKKNKCNSAISMCFNESLENRFDLFKLYCTKKSKFYKREIKYGGIRLINNLSNYLNPAKKKSNWIAAFIILSLIVAILLIISHF